MMTATFAAVAIITLLSLLGVLLQHALGVGLHVISE